MKHQQVVLNIILFMAVFHLSLLVKGQPLMQPIMPSVPTSPQAEAFHKYGDIAINHSMGIPDISIPLFKINHCGYTLPLTLKYNPLPLHPGYNYDVYGHGWGLSVSSCISRTIEYLPDEWRGFGLESDKLGNSFAPYKDDMANFNLNLGYDVFSVVMPNGESFEFVIRKGADGLEYVVSDNRSVKIDCHYSSTNIHSFTVVDEQGIAYDFYGADTPYQGIGAHNSRFYGSYVSWQLTSIHLPNSTESIEFHYALSMQSRYKRYAKEAAVLLRYNMESSPFTAEAFAVENNQIYCYKMKLLTSITYGSTSITLDYAYPTTSVEFNYVDGIRIKDDNVLIRDIRLDRSIHKYSYSNYPDEVIAKLKGVSISGDSGDSLVYQCSYTTNGGYFAGTDHWGYLNDSDVQYEVGNFNIFVSFNYDLIRNSPVAITKQIKSSQEVCPYEKLKLGTRSYDSRQPLDPERHGVLKRLTCPTGGYTEFDFENHRFLTSTSSSGDYIHDKSMRRDVKAGGCRIRRIAHYTSEDSLAEVRCFAYGEMDSMHRHTGRGEAVVDPNVLTYANYTNSLMFPLRYMLLGLSPSGRNELFTDPFNGDYPKQGVWGWECTFSVDNFRRILNGRNPVVYAEVTEYHGDFFDNSAAAENITGKTVYRYDIYDTSAADTLFFEAPRYFGNNLSYTPKKYRYNILTEKTDYLYENRKFRPVRQESYRWYKNYRYLHSYQYTNEYHTEHAPANISLHPFFRTKEYYLGGKQLVGHTVRTFGQQVYADTYSSIDKEEVFSYNIRNQMTEHELCDSYGRSKTVYTYPEIKQSGTAPDVVLEMVERNIISPLLEEKRQNVSVPASGVLYNTSGSKVEYGLFHIGDTSLCLPVRFYKLDVSASDTSYVFSHEALSYSAKGNLREVVSRDSVHTVYLWSYHDRYMIAEIKNATSGQVAEAVSAVFGMTVDALSEEAAPDVVKLRSLRNHVSLKDAHVSTFTHRPLIGVTSMTDPVGKTLYYAYDGLGRLTEKYYYEGHTVAADKKRTLQRYDYHYRNR